MTDMKCICGESMQKLMLMDTTQTGFIDKVTREYVTYWMCNTCEMNITQREPIEETDD